MRISAVLAVLLVPALAAAKPLPADLKIDVVNHKLTASQGPVSVQLTDHDVDTLGQVKLSDDGKAIVVAASLCGGMFGSEDEPQEYSLASVQAQLENKSGMRAHVKKQFADAIAHFASAVKLAPGTPLYATNLLSAQSMAGKLDDADRTIASHAPKNVAWFAWRLQVDPELKALKSRPSTKLGTAKRGTATSGLKDAIAYSPLGLAASEQATDMWDGIPDGSGSFELVIVDLRTGAELLRLPTEKTCAVDVEKAMSGDANPPYADRKCPAREKAAAAPRRKVADELLAQLGFDVVPKAYQDAIAGGEDRKEIVAADGRKLVTDKMLLVSGKKSKTIQLDGKPFGYAFVPGALVAITRSGKSVAGCEADGSYRMQLEAFATP